MDLVDPLMPRLGHIRPIDLIYAILATLSLATHCVATWIVDNLLDGG